MYMSTYSWLAIVHERSLITKKGNSTHTMWAMYNDLLIELTISEENTRDVKGITSTMI